MKSFIELITEDKTAAIKKMKNLSAEDKFVIVTFFQKNPGPHYENMIDWNNKNLTFDDFKKVMEAGSKTQTKKAVKKHGIAGLKEGKDYIDVSYMLPGYDAAYAPLNHEASKLIACDKIGGLEGHWCTASNDDHDWNSYTQQGVVLVYAIKDKYQLKHAFAIHKTGDVEMFDNEDDSMDNAHEFMPIFKKYKSDLDKIRSKYVFFPPEWVKKAVTKNMKWRYSSFGGFIFESGEWIKGTWQGGLFEGGTWHNGTWQLGTFSKGGVWKKGIWEYGQFRGGVWEDGEWQGGEWHGGYDKDGKYHTTSPETWGYEDKFIDYEKIFDIDKNTLEYLKNHPIEIDEIHKSYVDGRIRAIHKEKIGLKKDNNKIIISNAFVWDVLIGDTKDNWFKPAFKHCEIHGYKGFGRFIECTIFGGAFDVLGQSLLDCSIFDGVFTLLESTYYNKTYRNDIHGGKWMGNNHTHIIAKEAKNATFVNCYVEIDKCEKCKFFSCILREDEIRVDCATDSKTEIRNFFPKAKDLKQ